MASVIKILKLRILWLLENFIFLNHLNSVYRDIFIFTTYIHHNFLFFVFYFLFHFFCLWLCTYRQQELLYNAEFQIQQIERKVARGLGERSDEENRHHHVCMIKYKHHNCVKWSPELPLLLIWPLAQTSCDLPLYLLDLELRIVQ